MLADVKRPLIAIVLVAVVVFFFYIFVYPWFIIWLVLVILPNPPKPAIRYGEFPFRLTYELNGETKTIEDVAICEFDGYGERSEAGQDRKWKTHLKSGLDDLLYEKERGPETDTAWITLLDSLLLNVKDIMWEGLMLVYLYHIIIKMLRVYQHTVLLVH